MINTYSVNAYRPFRNSIVYYVFQETIFEIRYNTILQSIKSVKSLWLILFTDYYHIKRACCIAKTVLKFDISLKLFGTSKQYLQKKYISNFDTFLNKATNFHDFQYAKFSIQYACAPACLHVNFNEPIGGFKTVLLILKKYWEKQLIIGRISDNLFPILK
jgi:hypothetical protein